MKKKVVCDFCGDTIDYTGYKSNSKIQMHHKSGWLAVCNICDTCLSLLRLQINEKEYKYE